MTEIPFSIIYLDPVKRNWIAQDLNKEEGTSKWSVPFKKLHGYVPRKIVIIAIPLGSYPSEDGFTIKIPKGLVHWNPVRII